ncbi:MAG TPA: hypothetical protein VGN80_00375 [Devosiaceae bacterium]|nr:hypothetical protein [Devosiaceae bacterium]
MTAANPAPVAAQSCSKDEVEVLRGEGVGDSCLSSFNAGRCVAPGALYIHDGSDWLPAEGQTITFSPTRRVVVWDNELQQSIRTDAYEYLFVSDTRGDDIPIAVLGVLAARSTPTEHYDNISLFRNVVSSNEEGPNFNSSVATSGYQTDMRAPQIRNTEITNWMKVPGYEYSADRSRTYFAYRRAEEADNFWKSALKLRTTTGAVSCAKFELTHRAEITSISLRLFLQHRPEEAEEFTLEFE